MAKSYRAGAGVVAGIIMVYNNRTPGFDPSMLYERSGLMPFDYFVVAAAAEELNERLKGGRLEKIYQPDREELLLHFNVPPAEGRRGCRINLRISAHSNHPLIYISEQRTGNPQNPPGFCMLLRKHLLNGRLLRVGSCRGERILTIEFSVMGELGLTSKKTLVAELMGKHSNIFLLDPSKSADASDPDIPSGLILGAVKLVPEDGNSVRCSIPGCNYTPPPGSNGLSPVIAEEIKLGRGLDYFEKLAESKDYSPRIFTDDRGGMKDYYVFPLNIYEGLDQKTFPSVSSMLETWFDEKEAGSLMSRKKADLSRVVKAKADKLYLKKQRLHEDLTDAARADEYREIGELITANIYRMKQGMREVSLTPFDGGPEVAITMDPLLTPAKNAQRYFKRYSKAKTALTEKQKQLKATDEQISFLESYRVYIDNAVTDEDIENVRDELIRLGYVKQKKNAARRPTLPQAPLKYTSSEGLSIYVGRNNNENDHLTLKKAKPSDIWLHTKDIPGSHVILAGGPDAAESASIKEAASIAAWYSKAKDSENVPVDYTLVKYVKKPSGARPGMVIFTHNRTVYVKPELP